MPLVLFLPAHRRFTGGLAEAQFEALDFRSLIDEIVQRFPEFPQQELLNASVAIDGELVTRPWLEQLGEESHLVFVARIGAG